MCFSLPFFPLSIQEPLFCACGTSGGSVNSWHSNPAAMQGEGWQGALRDGAIRREGFWAREAVKLCEGDESHRTADVGRAPKTHPFPSLQWASSSQAAQDAAPGMEHPAVCSPPGEDLSPQPRQGTAVGWWQLSSAQALAHSIAHVSGTLHSGAGLTNTACVNSCRVLSC